MLYLSEDIFRHGEMRLSAASTASNLNSAEEHVQHSILSSRRLKNEENLLGSTAGKTLVDQAKAMARIAQARAPASCVSAVSRSSSPGSLIRNTSPFHACLRGGGVCSAQTESTVHNDNGKTPYIQHGQTTWFVRY